MNKSEELEKLRIRIENDSELPLRDNGKLVFGKGNPEAELVFIGEAPGQKEAESGIPFVGRAGQELDTFLKKIGLSLEEIYICNILKYRPPNNRDPNIDEIKKHTPYLLEQLKIIQPKIIITLGNYSSKFVLGGFSPDNMKTILGVSKIHGELFEVNLDNNIFKVVPVYHPAAMLYNPRLRIEFENDFLKIREILNNSKI